MTDEAKRRQVADPDRRRPTDPSQAPDDIVGHGAGIPAQRRRRIRRRACPHGCPLSHHEPPCPDAAPREPKPERCNTCTALGSEERQTLETCRDSERCPLAGVPLDVPPDVPLKARQRGSRRGPWAFAYVDERSGYALVQGDGADTLTATVAAPLRRRSRVGRGWAVPSSLVPDLDAYAMSCGRFIVVTAYSRPDGRDNRATGNPAGNESGNGGDAA